LRAMTAGRRWGLPMSQCVLSHRVDPGCALSCCFTGHLLRPHTGPASASSPPCLPVCAVPPSPIWDCFEAPALPPLSLCLLTRAHTCTHAGRGPCRPQAAAGAV
jgi:hypothetical protein